jgi:hypothetical protein
MLQTREQAGHSIKNDSFIPIKEPEFRAFGVQSPVSASLGDFQPEKITDDSQRD